VAQVVVEVDLLVRQLLPAGRGQLPEEVVERRRELVDPAPPLHELRDEVGSVLGHAERGQHADLHRRPAALGEEPGGVVDLEQLARHRVPFVQGAVRGSNDAPLVRVMPTRRV
jgi:hypothetical protein